MSTRDIKLRKGMTKDEVNESIRGKGTFKDDEYNGDRQLHRWKCKCGNETIQKWTNIRKNGVLLCDNCRRNRITNRHSEIVNSKNGYEYIGTFLKGDILPGNKIVNTTYLQVKHKYCGNIYEIKLNAFKDLKSDCIKCCGSYEKSFAHHIEVELGLKLEDVWDFEKNTVNPYYINKGYSKGKVWIKCRNTDYHGSYEVKCIKFIKGQNCPYCNTFASKKVHPLDSFGYHNLDKAQSWSPNNSISPFRVARYSSKKYKFICPECGSEFERVVNDITGRNRWCPKCSKSKGERRVMQWIRKNNIVFCEEKEFDGLVGLKNGNLRYDFYLPDYNILIEYDGLQHDKWIESWMSREAFETLQYHDMLKDKYAKINNIKLIRIKDKDFENIDSILYRLIGDI